MEDKVSNKPNPEQVRLIFKDTYNFYLKWKDIKSEDDFNQMWAAAKEINRNHGDCELCRNILINLCSNIKQEFKERSENKNG
ncbi:MAG: hypothetical protein K0R92_2815 [Lachnospiraceae bacterium]|jgi:hypothetical protein|nr:hypothetical protein [Lachnospiraceae bacterium]